MEEKEKKEYRDRKRTTKARQPKNKYKLYRSIFITALTALNKYSESEEKEFRVTKEIKGFILDLTTLIEFPNNVISIDGEYPSRNKLSNYFGYDNGFVARCINILNHYKIIEIVAGEHVDIFYVNPYFIASGNVDQIREDVLDMFKFHKNSENKKVVNPFYKLYMKELAEEKEPEIEQV